MSATRIFKSYAPLALGAAMIVAQVSAARAADAAAPGAPASTASQPEAAAAPPAPSIQSSLGKYGDPGGIRAFLDTHGIDYSFTYIGEVLGNTSGGVKRGATYEGRIDGNLDIDTEKLFGLKNGAIHVEAFQIHGRGLSGNNLQDLFTAAVYTP